MVFEVKFKIFRMAQFWKYSTKVGILKLAHPLRTNFMISDIFYLADLVVFLLKHELRGWR